MQIKKVMAVLVPIVIAIVGVHILTTSHAAATSPYGVVEAESGTVNAPATIQTDSNASVGKFVQFGPSMVSSLLPPAVPTSGAYVGAWINAGQVSGAGNGITNELAQLASFNQANGKPVSILHAYTGFNAPVPLQAMATMKQNGSIPLIDWVCSDVGAINAGTDDVTITAYARGLKGYASPVFLRWYWEMNLNDAGNVNCKGYNNGAGYTAAWQHIWKIFHSVGATNVAFVWCPSIQSDGSTYYPGDQYVDWIGVDGYDRKKQGSSAFSAIFGSFYTQWLSHSKPIMIAETAAFADTATNSAEQGQYIQGIQSVLPGQFPQIKAVIYFDSIGPSGDWSLQGSGTSAFSTLSNASYFTH